MGKVKKKQMKKREVSRQVLGMTLQKAIYLNRQMEAKVTQLRGLLKLSNLELCGSCGAKDGGHHEDCVVGLEIKFLEPKEPPAAETGPITVPIEAEGNLPG